MFGTKTFQEGHGRAGSPSSDQRRAKALLREESQFLQSGRLGACVVYVEILVRGATPEGQGALEVVHLPLRIGLASGERHPTSEVGDVEEHLLAEPVSGRHGDNGGDSCADAASEPADLVLQGGRRIGGKPVAPDRLDKPIRGHSVRLMQGQAGDKAPLSQTAKRHGPLADVDLCRPEHRDANDGAHLTVIWGRGDSGPCDRASMGFGKEDSMTTSEATTTSEDVMEWDGLQTWYRIVGDLRSGPAPLVICHGGPGATHDYLTSVSTLAESGRACVLYDQVGNGRSTHRPDAPREFWTIELFLRELDMLLRHLAIDGAYHLLGQSWGGMLAMEHALRHPAGLRSIVVADAPASTALWMAEAARLMSELPSEVRAVLDGAHASGTTDTPEYQEASQAYYRRHVCRLDPPPAEVQRTFAALHADPTVYSTMAGSSEFNATGTLRDWDITGRLGEIDVPTLVLSGRYDEATPRVVQPIADGIAGAEWVVFEESSHMPHVEEAERYLQTVERFLHAADASGP